MWLFPARRSGRVTVRSIYIVDDDDVVRASLHSLLSILPDIMIQSFRTGDAFLASQDDLVPGVLLLDIHMPGISGMDVLRAIEGSGKFATIMLTGRGDVQLAISAMKSGVVDFIEKPYEFDVLYAAIELAFARLEKDSRLQARVEQAQAMIDLLSPREKDVLAGLINGRSNKMIAIDLEISPRTVEIYRAKLMAKTQAATLQKLVRGAVLAGIA
jgi:two-component system response regulator FixJ